MRVDDIEMLTGCRDFKDGQEFVTADDLVDLFSSKELARIIYMRSDDLQKTKMIAKLAKLAHDGYGQEEHVRYLFGSSIRDIIIEQTTMVQVAQYMRPDFREYTKVTKFYRETKKVMGDMWELISTGHYDGIYDTYHCIDLAHNMIKMDFERIITSPRVPGAWVKIMLSVITDE